MTESNEGPQEGASNGRSAGQLLRAAREAQGMHVASLAAVLKVPAAKLEALEADRYDELQGATFVRALAQAACRALKIDPNPVLVRLPKVEVMPLGAIGPGINASFKGNFKGSAPARELSDSGSPRWGLLILVLVLVLAALAMLLLPRNFLQWGPLAAQVEAVLPASASAVASAVAPPPASAAASTVEPSAAPVAASVAASAPALSASEVREAAVAGAPLGASGVPSTAASAPAVVPTGGRGMVQFRAVAPSWVEVLDASGQSLIGRILHQGEMVNLEGALPLRVKVGNVAGTEVVFQGHPVDLKPLARDNVARLELK
ncbi:helix-turn-helix domain-containing protein [Ideonella sp. B508-1]|uniref:helix-turn-helix domain-containing protein n=1 Tax=Ideonella sp. B508-1 TaxID=137716 RepID=UPI0003B4A90C|nr:helix-turn-helix domain-containing protein [Ideonella sp. B508-1]